MSDDLYTATYNPDVISCLANLSNDEVFTPPEVANAMLDMLPQKLFENPDTKFLDPSTKSGVFLREIAKRLIIGLEDKIPDLQDRLDHIFHKQLYGIAITELTSLLARRSLYCSKYPNSIYSVSPFDDVQGNIRYRKIKHRFKNNFCIYCGASKSEYGEKKRGDDLETHAYEFIHTTKPEAIFNMKFDVIISNPPYQLSDSGNGKSAKPIYQYFVEQAMKLKPRYLTMVIPSRWFTGGKGLTDFRHEMLSDKRIRKLVDYENFKDIFPGVDLAGGACYFLWDRDNPGTCEVTNFSKDEPTVAIRNLDEYEVFIRQNKAVEIVKKVTSQNKKFLSDRVSSRKPFGLPTNYKPQEKGVPCWFIQRIGLKYAKSIDVDDTHQYLNKWKFLAPKAPIAGQTDFTKPVGFYYDGNTIIAKPGECCTESYIILGAFDTEDEVKSYKSYIFTKTVRFLLLQTVTSQDVTKKNYCFVPDLGDYSGKYTDEQLVKLWNLSDNEWRYIDSRIADVNEKA
ncbi:restriction endonuclease [Acidaminococcus fermentans]|uniref:site-specific DNA-methyltransferase (adenine-specific) n=1 Tax=Acidaminococcus fermentans TaxID=905 RepID=A0A6N7W1W1_ACIFE|nr:Eco57I restriction-modification methylase domain-containing protein [Acidaminococcus fermentans]MSS82138.1 restriction endonuclease [Acidaminococcus fermentans]